jgi:hypothetical protein
MTVPVSVATIPGASGMTVSVDPSGTYQITLPSPAWRFAGATPGPVSNLRTSSGADNLGAYNEISFDLDAARHASVRAWTERSGVLFTVKYTAASSNTLAFPNFSAYPRDMRHLTFSGTFAPPSFWYFAPESPWIFFDAAANSFILSPASNFMAASSTRGGSRRATGWLVRRASAWAQARERPERQQTTGHQRGWTGSARS